MLTLSDSATRISDLRKRIHDFIRVRNWEKYHNPKDLAISISIEASELLERFQWMNEKDVKSLSKSDKILGPARKELADIIIYCLSFANVMGIDISEAVLEKIEENSAKYPVEKVKNRYRKYTDIV